MINDNFFQKIQKVRVTNLTQGGLKAMEELAKLEEERGNPGYLPEDRVVRSDSKKRIAGHGRGSMVFAAGGKIQHCRLPGK